MDQPNQVQCSNCHATTTADGKTEWVCEQCGTQNPVVDVTAAQAVVDTAASSMPTPPPVTPPTTEAVTTPTPTPTDQQPAQ